MRRALLLAVSVTVAPLIAGCGGGSGSSTVSAPSNTTRASGNAPAPRAPSDRAAISKNAATVIAPGGPRLVCGDLTTRAYVRAAYGDQRGCRAAVSAQPSVEVRVTGIKVTGSSARAVAIPQNGPNRGERLRVALVSQGGQWLVSAVHSNAPVGP